MRLWTVEGKGWNSQPMLFTNLMDAALVARSLGPGGHVLQHSVSFWSLVRAWWRQL